MKSPALPPTRALERRRAHMRPCKLRRGTTVHSPQGVSPPAATAMAAVEVVAEEAMVAADVRRNHCHTDDTCNRHCCANNMTSTTRDQARDRCERAGRSCLILAVVVAVVLSDGASRSHETGQCDMATLPPISQRLAGPTSAGARALMRRVAPSEHPARWVCPRRASWPSKLAVCRTALFRR